MEQDDIAEGLSKFNNELALIECDYPFIDEQYGNVLESLYQEGLLPFDKIEWKSQEDEETDIFVRVFEKMIELYYSDGETNEFQTYMQMYVDEFEYPE